MLNAAKAADQPGPLGWVRSIAKRNRGLFESIRKVRFALFLGPWRGACMWALQHFSPNPAIPRSATTVFPGVSAEPFVSKLNANGLAPGMVLPPSSVQAIFDYSQTHAESFTGHVDCEAIRQIAFDPFILDVAKGYLGGEPVFFGSIMSWTSPNLTAQTTRPERFHYDVADFKSVCAFFYLTDTVDAKSGPHVLIEGTHRRGLTQLSTMLDDDTAAKQYGERVKVITGERGFGFFEDQFAYHKRLPCRERRLILLFNYTLHRKPDVKSAVM